MNSYGVRRPGGGRLIMGIAVALLALVSYFMSSEINPITGEKQHLSLSTDQEIAMGLQAAPEMARQFGGLAQDASKQLLADRIGSQLVSNSVASKTDWQYEFHVLADRETVNAFALPGGQLFITQALFDKLKTEDQIAGVLAHEISHVIARHSAQQLAKMQLTQGLSSAAVIASGDYNAGQMAAVIGQMVNMKYGRDDELEADTLGVRLMHEAGYDPNAMIEVMHILNAESKGARQPEFFSTHPNPDNRIQHIKDAISAL
jgi:beta-barrel assembly-enhancing protease